jgi:hypothetical protein
VNDGLQTNMEIASNGRVSIGTATQAQKYIGQLTVDSLSTLPAIVGVGSTSSNLNGFVGVQGYGGNATFDTAGDGGSFSGGVNPNGFGGNGISAGYGSGGNSTADGYAGAFYGNVSATGTIAGAAVAGRIDHPLDAANKYLVQAAVQSSEMVNIYSGNVTTDDLGIAVVHLPDWFEAENGDFRYQLTVVGERFAQAIVSSKIHDHQFTISTNATRVEVSWQVTGVRQDAYARAHPLVVEQAKSNAERGFYVHPELYGQPEEKQTEWARHPETMRLIKAHREAARQAQKPVETNAGIQPQLGPPASAVDRKFASAPGLTLKTGAESKPSPEAAQHPR